MGTGHSAGLLGIILLGLGFLGFSPFLMAAVYSRAARVAFPSWSEKRLRLVPFLIGVVVELGIPGAVQSAAARVLLRSLVEIASEDSVTAARATTRLRYWSPVVDLEQVDAAYASETDSSRRARIATAYQLTWTP